MRNNRDNRNEKGGSFEDAPSCGPDFGKPIDGDRPHDILKKRVRMFSTLRSRMMLYVFLTMLITVSVALGVVLVLVWQGMANRDNILIPLIFIGLSSLFIGSLMSLSIYKYIFHGFDEYLRAMKKVSKGDFDVKMPESDNYLNEMYHSFNLMVQSLKSIETLKTDFVSNFSHEFKTPISSICGFAKLLKSPNLSDEDKAEYINIIIAESGRLTYLAQNTLTLSKLENQEHVFEKKVYALDEQLRTCALLFQTEIEEKNITVDISENEQQFYGNESIMSQLWINLFSNAVKFTPDGGTVTVRLQNTNGRIIVSITDTGCGMSIETAGHIFEKFYQGDASRSGAGNGLGLSIAKKIAEIAGGEITVDSETGKGSTFTVSMPAEIPPQDGESQRV